MNSVLTNVGIMIEKDALSVDVRKMLSKKLTITIKTYGGWDKKTFGYVVSGKYFIIPRFAPVLIKKCIKLNVSNRLSRGRRGNYTKFLAELTDNQAAVKQYIMETYFTKPMRTLGLAGAIVNMPPGEGKTFLAMAVIHAMGYKTAIIVPNTYLLQQWRDLCIKYFPDTTVGVYYGAKKVDGDIVIHVINSALSDEFTCSAAGSKTMESDKWWSRFGLIVYDEIHMYCSESRAEIFQSAQSQYMLGLSATPDQRIDKLDPIALWNVGPVLNSCDVKGFAKNKTKYKTDIKVIKYNCDTEYAEIELSEAGTVSVPKMLNNFVRDPVRNGIILQEAMRLYHLGLCIFIFTDRRTHAEYLVGEIGKYQYEYGRDKFGALLPPCIANSVVDIVYDYLYPEDINVTQLLGGADDNDIYEAKTFSRIIVTTYAYSSTGVSIDKLNAAILATPRKNGMVQILGRIYRLAGDASITRRIVDLVDWSTPLKKQYYERRKTYLSKLDTNIEIVEI
jgi:hypothetical protein